MVSVSQILFAVNDVLCLTFLLLIAFNTSVGYQSLPSPSHGCTFPQKSLKQTKLLASYFIFISMSQTVSSHVLVSHKSRDFSITFLYEGSELLDMLESQLKLIKFPSFPNSITHVKSICVSSSIVSNHKNLLESPVIHLVSSCDN